MILHCFAEQPPPWGSPEERASFPSQLMFAWLDPLIYKGFRSTLVRSSLPRNPASIHTDANARDFRDAWEKERGQRRGEDGSKVSIWKVLFRVSRLFKLIIFASVVKFKIDIFIYLFLQLHGWRVFWASFVYLLHTLLQFVNPQVSLLCPARTRLVACVSFFSFFRSFA